MFNLLFKTTAYYVIWKKFKKHILLILSSIFLIGFIGIVYDDLFQVMKVKDKDMLGTLLFFKWFLIMIIIAINIYILRKTKIDVKEVELSNISNEKQNEKIIMKKGELFSTSDLILKKYEKRV
ncbi:MAG: hypothetical protein CL623_05950 [Arcobacter sp.]|nr:hypothetical protein [Arcobacter sp.]|tara:strand:+ start:7695 stop:8063 length:369 start_codon:yes stop_codon:yes gene_type:complete